MRDPCPNAMLASLTRSCARNVQCMRSPDSPPTSQTIGRARGNLRHRFGKDYENVRGCQCRERACGRALVRPSHRSEDVQPGVGAGHSQRRLARVRSPRGVQDQRNFPQANRHLHCCPGRQRDRHRQPSRVEVEPRVRSQGEGGAGAPHHAAPTGDEGLVTPASRRAVATQVRLRSHGEPGG